MKVEYTELIVLKSGVTTLRTQTFDVISVNEGHCYLDSNDTTIFGIKKEQIDSGPVDSPIKLHLGKVPLDRVDYCLADIKKVE